MGNKTTYNSLDIAKFGCALLIVCAHTAAEIVTFHRGIDLFFSLYIIAVPFFYVCSAFLFFSKLETFGDSNERAGLYWSFFKRVLVMYLLWSAIYFPFVVLGWIRNGTNMEGVLIYFHGCLVSATYPTIWFLPSLLIGVSIVFFLKKWLSYRAILPIGVLMYIIGSFGYSYAGVMQKVPAIASVYDWYTDVFVTTRNGLFNGFPFAALGGYIASSKRRGSGVSNFVWMNLFGALFIVEAFAIQRFVGFPVGGADTVLFLFPFTYFFFSWLLTIELENRRIYFWMRELSLLIFLSQRLFLSAIPSVIPPWVMDSVGANALIGMLTIVGLTVLFSLLLIELSSKMPGLKKLW